MKLATYTIDRPGQLEFDLMAKVESDFSKMAMEYPNYYSTIFFNEENRKITVKVLYGEIKEMSVNKLNINEE